MGLFNFKKKNDVKKTETENLDEFFSEGVARVTNYVKKQEEARERENREAKKMADYISGGIKQFNSAPGALRGYDIASKEAKKFLEEHEGILNGSPKGYTEIVDSQEKEFNNKFPQYLELKQILEDRKNGNLTPKLSKLVSSLESTAQQKCPGFVVDDLLIPFLLEKRSMGLATLEEFIFLEGKWDKAKLDSGLSDGEYAERIAYYVSLIGAFFYIKDNETRNLVGNFTYCLSNAERYAKLADSDSEPKKTSESSGISK